ncbi:hypothetical protein [Acinetobacter guillouiae]|uniref:hypothetical protein n=1 Tax=Acinetobacter guillouiae TaxID=106649 RepID=UPI0026E1568D|nr:hypothetical protein [Acinetobacter guillouiae]MDO6643237.1 hypothetical protein [Acinetobacter guillouiae]
MSGGISAIKGFDYQATVILDRLFDLFDQHGSTAYVRPEGEDDLDLFWIENCVEYRQYIQIKKPTETNTGVLNPTPWTLTSAAKDLFPNAILHLTNNNYEQIWILGDEVSKDLSELIDADEHAPLNSSQAYLTVIHKMTKDHCLKKIDISNENKGKIQRWKIPSNIDPKLNIEQKFESFSIFINTLSLEEGFFQLYIQEIKRINAILPNILSRIKILSLYGTEKEVVSRVYQRLEDNYQLQRNIIENTLFRNLRGFINDISKQTNKTFNKEDFELELRTVWPTMVIIKEPPLRGLQFLPRTNLVTQIAQEFTGKAIEITGVSGSGKTSLASEILEYIRSNQPDRNVFYANVTENNSLIDVLSGVAFHLRRYGITTPFKIAIDNQLSTENTLQKLAKSLSSCSLKIILLIDLVHGTCSDSFAKALNHFISSISSQHLQIAIFSQEMPLREISSSSKLLYKIEQLNIPGFKFEEFVQLVTYQHQDVDRSKLLWIYQRITVGRETGLLVSLAQTLAHVETIEDMRIIAEIPADEMLAEAERKRFDRVSPTLVIAAKKLTCFALPFSRTEAIEIFPTANIREAIHELLILGLLRKTGDDLYEMHETVRAGLESFISLDIYRTTHVQLAEWYAEIGNITAQIFHLEKSGNLIKAHAVAKDAFLKGKDIWSLKAYILKNNLITQKDILNMLSNSEIKVTDYYILPELVKCIGNAHFIEQLFELIKIQPNRFQQDFHWSTSIMRMILEFDITKLHTLITFVIKIQKVEDPENSVLDWFTMAAHRIDLMIDPSILNLFENQRPEIKRKLIPILLLDWRRDILKPVFNFITTHPIMRKSDFRTNNKINLYQKFDNIAKTTEFLAALPNVDIDKILVTKSACLDVFEDYIWENKDNLTKNSIAIIKQNDFDEIVINNALRILLFLAEPSLPELCNSLQPRTNSTSAFISLLPSVLPSLPNKSIYENDFFDTNLALDKRITALSTLLAHDADIGELYRRIQKIEPLNTGWNFWFLMQSLEKPFPEAIPLLEARLASENDRTLDAILLVKLGELSTLETLNLLINSLNHTDVIIRRHAALVLSTKRSTKALPYLVKQLALEVDDNTAVTILTAIVASGSTHTSDLSLIKFTSPTIELWKCILAMRARDISFAERIVSLACNKNLPWQTRRTAILAAGRLPFDIALNSIVPNIIKEHSPLIIDNNSSLLAHNIVSERLLTCGNDIIDSLSRGKDSFIYIWGWVFEQDWEDCLMKYDLPTGDDIADWLFERLTSNEYPPQTKILDQIINELHIPILHAATLRSLRLCNKTDLLEYYLAQSSYVWFAIRCLKELHLIPQPKVYSLEKILGILSLTPWQEHPIVENVVNNLFMNKKNKEIEHEDKFIDADSSISVPPVIYLNYNDILNGLEQPQLVLDKNFAFSPLTREEIEQLITLLNTPYERSTMIESIKPQLDFTSDGYTVAKRSSTFGEKSSSMQLKTLLRPALAAANQYEVYIPWHEDGLQGAYYDQYIDSYIKFLGLQNDSEHFYRALALEKKILIPAICEYSKSRWILKYIDSRIISFINPLVLSGNSNIFEGLCMLAAEVNTDDIDLVLRKLFSRFVQFFNKTSQINVNYNIQIWRGFNYITNHKRFEFIPNLVLELTTVLKSDLTYSHKQDILRILERHPSSYITIESQLINTSNFECFTEDEVDRFDDAAEKLFNNLIN